MARTPNKQIGGFSPKKLRLMLRERSISYTALRGILLARGVYADVAGYLDGHLSPSVPMLVAMAQALDCSLDDLVEEAKR